LKYFLSLLLITASLHFDKQHTKLIRVTKRILDYLLQPAMKKQPKFYEKVWEWCFSFVGKFTSIFRVCKRHHIFCQVGLP